MTHDDEIDRARDARRGTPFLNTPQAAAWLGLSQRRLEAMRSAGEGPDFRRHGHFVRYHVDDLIAWSKAQTGKGTGA